MQAAMASLPATEKSGNVPETLPQLTVTTSPAAPEKALVLSESTSTSTLTPTASHDEKGLEVRRDSNLSTPRSCRQDNPFDTDIEAMITTTSTNDCLRRSLNPTNSDCRVWPGQDQWKKQAKAAKLKNRSCTCMAKLNPRTRIIVKILIALFVIGAAVGVGFGISKPLGAPIWGSNDKQ